MNSLSLRLKKIRTQMAVLPELRSILPLLLTLGEEISNTPTAYTNGFKIVYGEEFCNKLDDRKLFGLVLHELGHVIFKHCLPSRNKGMDKFLVISDSLGNVKKVPVANIATDMIVEAFVEYFQTLYPDRIERVLYNQYPNWFEVRVKDGVKFSMKENYDYLINLFGENNSKGSGSKSRSESNSNSDSDSVNSESSPVYYEEPDSHDELTGSDDEVGGKNKEAEEIIKASASRAVNNSPFKTLKEKSLTCKLSPEEVFKFVLKNKMTYTRGKSSYRILNRRRNDSSIIYPGKYSKDERKVLFLIDVSGSISDKTKKILLNFMEQSLEIVSEINVIFWSDVASDLMTFNKVDDIDFIDICGGTEPECVVPKVNFKPSMVVWFTDGLVMEEFPNFNENVTVFVINKNGCKDHIPNNGIVIDLEEE